MVWYLLLGPMFLPDGIGQLDQGQGESGDRGVEVNAEIFGRQMKAFRKNIRMICGEKW